MFTLNVFVRVFGRLALKRIFNINILLISIIIFIIGHVRPTQHCCSGKVLKCHIFILCIVFVIVQLVSPLKILTVSIDMGPKLKELQVVSAKMRAV